MEPPPWYFPVRQLLGAVLLAAGRPAEATAAYREDLARNPENGWSLYGLSQSLAASGDRAGAAEAERRFTKTWARADVKLESSVF
jgi:predicted Zn-dependent protease